MAYCPFSQIRSTWDDEERAIIKHAKDDWIQEVVEASSGGFQKEEVEAHLSGPSKQAQEDWEIIVARVLQHPDNHRDR